MIETSAPRQPPAPVAPHRSGAIRGDIQGLRALAVILVLIFHLWPNRLGGGYVGVDVFLVISGFLITSHLLGRPPSRLRDVGAFWARRIRRLLPASFLVLAVTLIASRLIAPETQWSNTAADVRGATLYVLNWRLAENSVDYLAADDAPSPVQHFWSLSVEEQFYAFWPLLILLLGALAATRGRQSLALILSGLSVVVFASFVYSVWMAEHDPAVGYFVTPTRIWELGVGALLAGLLLRRERAGYGHLAPDGPWRAVATVVGLAAVMWAAFTFSGSTPFPGVHAALPVLGSALLIAIGPAASPRWLDRVLDNSTAVRVGDWSYSIYLWHWPMIVLLPTISGGQLGRLDKAVIIVATFVLSALTKTWIEDRFRRPRSGARRTMVLRPVFASAVVGMTALVALTLVQDAEVEHRRELARAELTLALQGDDKCFGANATVSGARCPEDRSGAVVPAPAQAVQDRGDAFYDGCREQPPFDQTATCTYGDPDGDVHVAIAGNSHSLHWVPALDRIGRESGWRVTTYISAGCSPTDVRTGQSTPEAVTGCYEWGQRVQDKLDDGDFDLVVMSTLAPSAEDDPDGVSRGVGGHRSYLASLTEGGGPRVVVIKDVPAPRATLSVEVPDCVAQNRDDLLACSGPRSTWVRDDSLTLAARDLNSDAVSTVDLTERFCDERRCRTVIGGVLVYAERSHITATYSRSVARFLAEPLTRAINSSG